MYLLQLLDGAGRVFYAADHKGLNASQDIYEAAVLDLEQNQLQSLAARLRRTFGFASWRPLRVESKMTLESLFPQPVMHRRRLKR